MKKLLFIVLVGCFVAAAKAQSPSPKEQSAVLDNLKKQGLLTGKEYIYNPKETKNLQVTQTGNRLAKSNSHNSTMASSTSCNCWIPRDTSFHIVPFDGSGGSGAPIPGDTTYANDDWSTHAIVLPFNFCLYGSNVGDTTKPLYINNNGNISLGAPYSTFSSVAFPTATYTMIAPFWGDVETTNPGSGFVYYQLTATHLIIQWDSVTNYQSTPGSNTLKNTFQLIITDGTDSILPNGYNTSFCYGDMQWTTGDASGGTNGFGGTPATVGINKGNGVDYMQISRFNNNGNIYTNPAGSPTASGIDWLSNSSFSFDACGSSSNLPPLTLSNSSPCTEDTLTAFAGSRLSQTLSFIGPEPSQNITVTASSPNLGSGFSVTSSSVGTTGSIAFDVNTLVTGFYNVVVTAIDNGTPVQSTTLNYIVHVLDSTSAVTTGIKNVNAKQISIYPNPNNGTFVIETNSTAKQLVQVYDVTGKMVLSQNINGKTNIDAANLNEGVYSVSITSSQGKTNKRLVIVK